MELDIESIGGLDESSKIQVGSNIIYFMESKGLTRCV